MPLRPRVALLGFSESDHNRLESLLTLAPLDKPAYKLVADLPNADLAIVDADDVDAMKKLLAQARVGDAVLVGSPQALRLAPGGALARVVRPFEPLHAVNQLDARAQEVVKARQAGQAAAESAQRRRKLGVRARLAARQTEVLAFRQSTGFSNSVLSAEDRRFDTVLVADRDEHAREQLAGDLQHLGYSVVQACDGPQALGLLRSRAFEFAFLEVGLEGHDGYALCRRVRKHPLPGCRPAKVVLMSARVSPVDRIRGTLAGCDALVAKPYSHADLVQTLSQLDPSLQRTFEDTAPPWEPAA